MKNPSPFRKDLVRTLLTLLPAAVMSALVGCSTSPTPSTTASQSQTTLLFVQSADDLKVDPAASTFRLVKVNQQTLYFADRPQRTAGHYKMADYLDEWTAKAGKDNFTKDPPNAVLSVFEPGQADNKLVVVKISNPEVEGADLVYSYKVLQGTMPAGGGATSLFIDGIGRGVGAGHRGVGVGGPAGVGRL